MTIEEAKLIIFQAQMAAYPNRDHAAKLGELYALVDELDKYRSAGHTPEEFKQAYEIFKTAFSMEGDLRDTREENARLRTMVEADREAGIAK